MQEKIKEFMIRKTGCTVEQLKDDLELSDLGIDSIKLLLIINDFEEEFSISISDEELLKLHTYKDLVGLVVKEHEQ